MPLHADLTTVLAETRKALSSSGMAVNDKPNKTEVVCEYAGATSANELTAAMARTHIKCEHPTFGKLSVQVVDRYRHLGSYNTGAYRLGYEACTRGGQCSSAFTSLKKKLFASIASSQRKRHHIWQALCQSKLLHHVGIWGHQQMMPCSRC